MRVVDDPTGLIPAGGRLAKQVSEYVAAGEELTVLAGLSVEQAGAVLLVTEAMRQTCPPDVTFSAWCGAFLLSWEMRAVRGVADV